MRSFPSCKGWRSDFGEKEFALVGVHTPDPAPTKSLDNIRRAVRQAGLEHPIAVDPGFAMWKKLKHYSWPAYFLIDRQGRLRFCWLGGLKGEKVDGDKQLRARIEELLKEKA